MSELCLHCSICGFYEGRICLCECHPPLREVITQLQARVKELEEDSGQLRRALNLEAETMEKWKKMCIDAESKISSQSAIIDLCEKALINRRRVIMEKALLAIRKMKEAG